MSDQTEALKPCPFCGGPVQLEEANRTRDYIMGERRWWGVVCRNTTNQGGTCCMDQVPSASKEAAIARWNLRRDSRIEADEALMREMRENVIWAFGELNGIDVADDNNCMKATLAALGNIDTALRKRLESSK